MIEWSCKAGNGRQESAGTGTRKVSTSFGGDLLSTSLFGFQIFV